MKFADLAKWSQINEKSVRFSLDINLLLIHTLNYTE